MEGVNTITATYLKSIHQNQTTRIEPSEVDDWAAEWEDLPYQPNRDCFLCNGYGYVHPTGDSERVRYDKSIPCPGSGCLLEAIRAYKGGSPFAKAHGVTAPEQTFDTFKPVRGTASALKFAKQLAEGDSSFVWLLIYGGVGNGKTHLCNAVAKTCLERGLDVRMTSAADMFSGIRLGIEQHKAEQVIKDFKDMFVLVIDDLGVEYGTDWEAAKFDEIMTSRYATAKPTVVTTNNDISQMPPRIRSRFEDRKQSRISQNTGADYRKERR